jgi:hypothetical protein
VCDCSKALAITLSLIVYAVNEPPGGLRARASDIETPKQRYETLPNWDQQKRRHYKVTTVVFWV